MCLANMRHTLVHVDTDGDHTLMRANVTQSDIAYVFGPSNSHAACDVSADCATYRSANLYGHAWVHKDRRILYGVGVSEPYMPRTLEHIHIHT